MRPMNMKKATFKTQLFLALVVAATLFLTPVSFAAVPGINGTGTPGTFNLTAQDAYLNMPDGEAVYSWGYGCVVNPSGSSFLPQVGSAPMANANCPTMQVPGPTLIVTEGSTVIVSLTNNLPPAAGNTSILFPGFQVTTSCSATTPVGQQGLLTCEAAPGGMVNYTFTASNPGTHPYYSGTQGDLQVEMGLYGAVIVLPATIPANCSSTSTAGGYHYLNAQAQTFWTEKDFRLTNATGGKGAAYDHPGSCYDREYLFQWGEMDSRIHRQAQAQVQAKVGCTAGATGCSLEIQTEPYHPAYFVINGRSMPDLMDPNFASEYPHQPYNGNPHMHPGELTLVRTIGQGRWEHPFHEHANHVRILSRDGNLVLSAAPTTGCTAGAAGCVTFTSGLTGDAGVTAPGLAGLLMFNTDTTPGESFDGIFYFTGRGLNWDPFGHHPPSSTPTTSSLTITGLSETANVVTATVTNTIPTSLLGQQVIITNAANISGSTTTPIPGYNGTFVITAVTSPYTFTFTDPTGSLGLANSGTSTFNVNVVGTSSNPFPTDPLASLPCTADVNGYNSMVPTAVNFMEWCQDHNKPVQVNPFGDVAAGGPATLPDPNVFTNGPWYGGTPYFGPDASLRASMVACDTTTNANCTTLLPSNVQLNPPNERGWAFMWHSHNEREITTNNVFPGGMLMMMLVDSREFVIDESQ